MSRPIKITEDLFISLQEEFTHSILNTKMFDGKVSFQKTFKWDDNDRASIVFSAAAFAKMTMLVQNFSSEVAWHGLAYRDDKDPSKFYITDIVVYPQVVTGATVNTDQAAYTNWLYSFDDEQFNAIRMQGHSHVGMPTNPSGVDTTHQEKILEQVDDTMFYIFMIWNKKFEHTIKIYDMENNTLYEDADIDVLIGGEGNNLNEFLKAAKELVKYKTYNTPGYQYNQPAQTPAKTQDPLSLTSQSGGNNAGTKSKPKQNKNKGTTTPIGNSGTGYNYGTGYEDEYEDDYYQYH